MQIIIPMSGISKRFIDAGYSIPKYLLPVGEKTIISHVVDMFPGKNEFTFICNEDHLARQDLDLKNYLRKLVPNCKVFSIKPHKMGPVYALYKIIESIRDEEPVIINYCDFSCYWDFEEFCNFVQDNCCDGAIPAYRGFHPHNFGSTNYAYIKHNRGEATDIAEKKPFTSEKSNEFASSGTYFFKSGNLLKKSIDFVFNNNLQVGGEYYCSLLYKYFFKNNLKVNVYELQHFYQWGTPNDYEEFLYWFQLFTNLNKSSNQNEKNVKFGNLIVPMAGLGSRFSDEGYEIPKPFIEVSGSAMIEQVLKGLPKFDTTVFVIRSGQIANRFKNILNNNKEKWDYVITDKLTAGQAVSCKLGSDYLRKRSNFSKYSPITFVACDTGFLIENNDLAKKLNFADVVVWVSKSHPGSKNKPTSFSWVVLNDLGEIENAILKSTPPFNGNERVMVGSFTFKNIEIFEYLFNYVLKKSILINGEVYIDSLIKTAIDLDMKCVCLEVKDSLSWGTPFELKCFEYWQSCFDKWIFHPYNMESDPFVDKSNLMHLRKSYNSNFSPVVSEG